MVRTTPNLLIGLPNRHFVSDILQGNLHIEDLTEYWNWCEGGCVGYVTTLSFCFSVWNRRVRIDQWNRILWGWSLEMSSLKYSWFKFMGLEYYVIELKFLLSYQSAFSTSSFLQKQAFTTYLARMRCVKFELNTPAWTVACQLSIYLGLKIKLLDKISSV